MPFKPDLVDELNVLIKFKASSQEGLKVHKTAAPELIGATQRLFEKGMITQQDGGYLTPLGQEAVQLAQSLHNMMAAETDGPSEAMKMSLNIN